MAKRNLVFGFGLIVVLALLLSFGPGSLVIAQQDGEDPVMLDPSLQVRTVVEGLTTPTMLAFLGEDEMLVLEKNTGQVQHVAGGQVQGTALDLAVNAASERGLLGIALDPDFDNNGYVYLYWTCSAPAPTATPYFPSEIECADEPQLGEDSEDVLAVPLLGNRVDRFVWDGATLTWDLNLVKLRVFQNDAAPIPREQGDEEQNALGNHDGGVITFGQDGKLYIIIGDVGRRGALQNLPLGPIASSQEEVPPPGPSGSDLDALVEQGDVAAEQLGGLAQDSSDLLGLHPVPDDQFGGPFPDDAHYTGVILRLNNDGSIPEDNPFFDVGAAIGGEIGENIQMTFAYGIRNSFGMAVDPLTGNLWISENGEDAFDELNLVLPGQNSGWIQIMGPLQRLNEYKEIETTSLHNEPFPNLQQLRWGPENIADSPGEALLRLFWVPGSRFSNPEFSWKYVLAPAAIGFVEGQALGEAYEGDMFVGLSVPEPEGGALFRFELREDRMGFQFEDPALEDMVADNEEPRDMTESESLLIGTNFGIVTDIESGPNGNLYVVSLSNGAVYEIFAGTDGEPVALTATLTGEAEVPGPGDPDGSGTANVLLNEEANEVCFDITVADITLPATGAHIHQGEAGVAGDIVVPFEAPGEDGTASGCVSEVDPNLIADIIANPAGYYVNVHTSDFPAGAIRGQLEPGG